MRVNKLPYQPPVLDRTTVHVHDWIGQWNWIARMCVI